MQLRYSKIDAITAANVAETKEIPKSYRKDAAHKFVVSGTWGAVTDAVAIVATMETGEIRYLGHFDRARSVTIMGPLLSVTVEAIKLLEARTGAPHAGTSIDVDVIHGGADLLTAPQHMELVIPIQDGVNDALSLAPAVPTHWNRLPYGVQWANTIHDIGLLGEITTGQISSINLTDDRGGNEQINTLALLNADLPAVTSTWDAPSRWEGALQGIVTVQAALTCDGLRMRYTALIGEA